MTQDLYEVAYSGQIAEDVDLDQVKANIAKMFKADEAKVKQLFSGARVVIKRNIDLQTAEKYRVAMNNAGAICEIVNLSAAGDVAVNKPAPVSQATPAVSVPSRSVPVDHAVPPAPETVPLKISGDQIADLQASLAPVGSDMQDIQEKILPPPPDTSGLSMAPVGTDLAKHEEKKSVPIPDTSGLSLLDN
ncbi:MAG: hypothetical protein EP315_06035 [Gammaproteobacteria bacterium]|nr:MAG: hypothetical protein EP315_06035 [Gammaproteobacteria bacterium]